jgi:hypothetical protein
LAGDSIEFQTGYFTNTNLEYRVYVILNPVLNETTQESRAGTKKPKLFDAKCMCVAPSSVEVPTGNC